MRPLPLAIAVLAVLIGLVPVLPTEHIHSIEDSSGHPHAIAHSHVQFHAPNGQHHQNTALDDSDPIITLERWFSAPLPVFEPTIITTAVTTVEIPSIRGTVTEFIQLRAHGPPGAPSGLRAPPFLPSL